MDETTKSPKAPAKPRKTAAKKSTAKAAAAPKIVPAATATDGAPVAAAPAPVAVPRNGAAAASVSRDEIARLAHKFWAERGHLHGHHVEDWLRAEQELRKKAS